MKSSNLQNQGLINLINRILLFFIRSYQILKKHLLDPLLFSVFGFVSECKYQESCSHYASRQLQTRATIPALRKIWRRVWSCHN